jgi:signal transduction histidine kinase
LLRFAAAAAVAFLVVGLATVFVAYQISRDVALRHAEARGASFARVVAAPLVDDRLRKGDRHALRDFSRVMDNRLAEKTIVHIKVWDQRGRVLWSDTPGQRGQVYPLEPAVARVARTGGAIASMSELDRPENAGDTATSPLLKVYVGTRDKQDEPVLVETYWASSQIDTDVRAVMLRLAPLPLIALLLFAASLLPLARSLARRVDAAQADSQKHLQHALSASDLERRRVARDLHDGVMQDVSAAGYALSAVSTALPAEAETSRRLVGEVSTLLRQVGESLRSLVADIYPPNLARDGLSIAVEDLADRAADQGVTVQVDIPVEASRDLPLPVAQLCYRVIREALRNVVRHAQATTAEVRAVIGEGEVWISVADDGRGLPEPRKDASGSSFGLRLLEDTLVDLGGELALEPGARGGAVLSATVPFQVGLR